MKSKLVQVVTWTLIAAMALTGLYVGFASPPVPQTPAAKQPVTTAPPPVASAPAPRPAPRPARAPEQARPVTLEHVDRPEGLGAPGTPVLVGLHGRGDMAVGFAGLAAPIGGEGHNEIGLAWHGLQGPYRFGSGASWFTGDRKQPVGLEASVAAVSAELRALRKQGRKVGLFGFSQGCMMIAHLVLTAPDAIDGAICIGGSAIGTLPTPTAGAKLPPVLLVAGTADAMVPIEEQRGLATVLQAAGVTTQTLEHPGGHRIPGEHVPAMRAWVRRHLSGGVPTAR